MGSIQISVLIPNFLPLFPTPLFPFFPHGITNPFVASHSGLNNRD
jgi:hypothetical protein